MKTLYVSDLDGTLLNMKQGLNEETAEELNELISKGVNFTISTGRGDSVRRILEQVNFNYPIMLLNGTLNYDFEKGKYVDKLFMKGLPYKMSRYVCKHIPFILKANEIS